MLFYLEILINVPPDFHYCFLTCWSIKKQWNDHNLSDSLCSQDPAFELPTPQYDIRHCCVNMENFLKCQGAYKQNILWISKSQSATQRAIIQQGSKCCLPAIMAFVHCNYWSKVQIKILLFNQELFGRPCGLSRRARRGVCRGKSACLLWPFPSCAHLQKSKRCTTKHRND